MSGGGWCQRGLQACTRLGSGCASCRWGLCWRRHGLMELVGEHAVNVNAHKVSEAICNGTTTARSRMALP